MATLANKNPSPRTAQGKDTSVMAWIEDPYGHILMVKQTAGKKLWTLPGGKVRRHESLLSALRREVHEETGLSVSVASQVDLFDRYQKGNLTILFRVLIKKQTPTRSKKRALEISDSAYKSTLPVASTPSARFFWKRAQHSFEPLSLISTPG
ncbi:MAG: NUDIX hydrolase [Blastochloris sp.]|nr:NUDIX hydrolase [Blastochloris sp.]